jgi:general secretion pathway protein D
MSHKYLRVFAAFLALILLAVWTLQAKPNPDKLFKLGQAAEAKKDWDKALEYYLQALDAKPNDMGYNIAMRRARFQSGELHIGLGQRLRTAGKLQEAMGEFQKALIADPGSSIAIQEIKRTQTMIDGDKSSKPDERGLTPSERSRRDTDARIATIQGPPELKPVLNSIGPLKMNNQPAKILYETVGKLAGVNVLFDSQYTPPTKGFNVELQASTPDEAFNYLAVLTHTFWKPIAGNAVFVTEDNPTKHRDYDDEVVKTFYITNATSVQEFQEIATAIRTVADIRRVFTYNAQKAMIVRGASDAVALAEKLVHDLDKPKSEVVIDIVVMQSNSSYTRALAASLVNASTGTAGLNVPIVYNPQNPVVTTTTTIASGATGTTGVTITTGATGSTGALASLSSLRHLSSNDFAISLPNAMLNLVVSNNKTKVLNSPTLRVSDGMKATLKVGQRVPYATGSFQPGVGTVGVSPLVSTQFNYADVGVNVEITPQVHSNSEVTLHISVEVSSIAQYVNLGGISQPVIGQNKNEADLRLRDGEVNILGGLGTSSDSNSVSGIPGLVNIPVLGNTLFGQQNIDREKQDLLIAITPHIVRTPDYTPENLKGIFAGTDATVKLNYAPRTEPAAETAPVKPEAPKPPAGTSPASATAPVPVPPAGPLATPGPKAPVLVGEASVSFDPVAVQAKQGSPVTITVHAENIRDLAFGTPIRIKFDPTFLRLNDIAPGELFSRDGSNPVSTKDIRNDTGEATLTVSRSPGSAPVSGSGSIAVLNFVAVGKGTSPLTVIEAGLKNGQNQPITVKLAPAPVTIQ